MVFSGTDGRRDDGYSTTGQWVWGVNDGAADGTADGAGTARASDGNSWGPWRAQ